MLRRRGEVFHMVLERALFRAGGESVLRGSHQRLCRLGRYSRLTLQWAAESHLTRIQH